MNGRNRTISKSSDNPSGSDKHDQFVLLLLAHRHRIIAFISKQLVNSNDVEDVFQKTSLVLWKKMDQFDQDGNFFSWACGIAFNEVRNHIRVKGRDRLHFNPDLIDLLASEATEEDELSITRMKALNTCIEQLPNPQRQLLRQCYLDLKSTTDVAEDHGLSRGALYKQLARIKQKLLLCIRSRIESEGQFA